jgi:hypothetical protein
MARCMGEWPLSLSYRTHSNVATCRRSLPRRILSMAASSLCKQQSLRPSSSALHNIASILYTAGQRKVWTLRELQGMGVSYQFVWGDQLGEHIITVLRSSRRTIFTVPTDRILQLVDNASRSSMWFVRDRASEYFTRQVCECVDSWFPEKWIVPGEHVARPARLPGLSTVDYSKWGYLKEFHACHSHEGPECWLPYSERCSKSLTWITRSIATIVGIHCAT